jgi:glycerol-3-phosphate acyltransferase PlsY
MPIGIFIALFGYLLGSVPTGLLLTKLFSKVDPRKIGSKNIGATNIFRTAGKALGILTLVGDVLRGRFLRYSPCIWFLRTNGVFRGTYG